MGDISRYDQPAQSNAQNTFVQTYSPIPFNEMMAVGQMKQQQYEQGMNALMKTYEDTYNLRYIPNTEDEQYIKGQVIPTTKEIFDKYSNEDISDPVVRRQLRQELAQKIDKSKVKDIQDSYIGWMQNEQTKQKLASEDRLDPYEEDKSTGYDTGRNGIFHNISVAYSDPIADLQKKFFQPLKDTLLRDAKGNLKTTSRGYNLEGVTNGIVQNVVDKNLDTEVATREGRRAINLYRDRYGITKDMASDKDVLKKAFTEAGEPFVRESLTGSPYPEWMSKQPKATNPQYPRIERTPILNTDNRDVKSSDFKLQTSTIKTGSPTFNTMGVNLLSEANPNRNKKVQYYNKEVLNKKEVKNLVKLMPEAGQKMYETLLDPRSEKLDPETYKNLQKQFYSTLEGIYKQLEQELQQGTYLNAYYPSKIEGIPESNLNNVDINTKYTFGTDQLKELGSGQITNRDFMNPETGETFNGKDFYDKIVKRELKSNPNGLIKVTGDYHYENPFVAMTDNENFSNAHQVTVNGKQYVMSGEAAEYNNPIAQYKKNANRSYTLVKFNPGIPIDEKDGTIKGYEDGKYYIHDANTGEPLANPVDANGRPKQFSEVYNEARETLMSRNKK
jgi:hypothetical protein